MANRRLPLRGSPSKHGRWRRQIENEGCNEHANHWHADNYFHHHSVAIAALWLILFAAHGLFFSFWTGNLKSPPHKAWTLPASGRRPDPRRTPSVTFLSGNTPRLFTPDS